MTKDNKKEITSKVEEEDIFAMAPGEESQVFAPSYQRNVENTPAVEELPDLEEVDLEDVFTSAPEKESAENLTQEKVTTKISESKDLVSKVGSAEEILAKKLAAISLEELGIEDGGSFKEQQELAKDASKEATLEEKLQEIDLSELDDITTQEEPVEEPVSKSELKEEILDRKSTQKLSPKQLAAAKEMVLANNTKQSNKAIRNTNPTIKDPDKWLTELMELIKNPK